MHSPVVDARRRRMLGGDVMANLFGGDEGDGSSTSPLSETEAVARQRRKMLGGSAMSAMLGGGDGSGVPPPSGSQLQQQPQRQNYGHPQQQLQRHQQQLQQHRGAPSHAVKWGLQMIKDKCEGRGQSLSNFFVRNTEGDGSIDYREYQVLLRKLNINIDNAVQDGIFRHLDRDGNGSISLYEFLGERERPHRQHHTYEYGSKGKAYEDPTALAAAPNGWQQQQLQQQQQRQQRHPQLQDEVPGREVEWAEKALIAKIEAKRRSMRKVFLAIDNDRDGCVSFAEFQTLLRQLNANLGPGVAEAVFQRYDRRGSGEIHLEDFIAEVKGRAQPRKFGQHQQVMAAPPLGRRQQLAVAVATSPVQQQQQQHRAVLQLQAPARFSPGGSRRLDALESELARHQQIVQQLRREIEQERQSGASASNGDSNNGDPAAAAARGLQATSELYEVPTPSATRKSLSEAALEMMHSILDGGNGSSGNNNNNNYNNNGGGGGGGGSTTTTDYNGSGDAPTTGGVGEDGGRGGGGSGALATTSRPLNVAAVVAARNPAAYGGGGGVGYYGGGGTYGAGGGDGGPLEDDEAVLLDFMTRVQPRQAF